ncbi:MAG: hypothetical protein DDT38_00673 [Firmicutes bacterium]|nr:hypothetical protein [candidate division NPL-UPA2 bacterium]
MKLFSLWRLRWRIFVIHVLSYFGVQIAPKYIYFIGSSEALPPPLSEDEEHFLVAGGPRR